MAFTRLGQWGAELQSTTEWQINGATEPVISNTKARTGSYSARYTNTTSPIGFGTGSVTQIRAGVWLNHNGRGATGSGNYAIIFQWVTPAGNTNYVRWNNNTNVLELVVANSVVTSVGAATAGFTTTDQWYHCGLTVFANGSTGWASFYLDGVQQLTGTSLNTSTAISAVYCGGSTLNGWANYAYFDDMYVDSASSEDDAAPQLKRFLWGIANGNGTTSEWVGSDGNSTDNYQLVDDAPPDGDTTYVYTQTTAKTDLYAMGNVTVPTGYSLVAAIPVVMAKRAGSTEQVQLLAYDGANTTTGTAQDPAASYAPVWERMTTQPDGTDWNETDFNAMQFGVKSAGTF